ncbi:MAG: hypothetical protein ACP5HG_06895 [Anaerolineae bacterium]
MLTRTMRALITAMLVWMSVSVVPALAAPVAQGREPDPEYVEAIERTAAMVWDPDAQRLVSQHGLEILNVTWEDTGRYYDSAVGPNISDMTIQVQHRNPRTGDYELTLMPVIRYPNFTDLSADVSPDRFYLLVGNEDGEPLERVTLTEYLSQLPFYLHDPDSWTGDEVSLMARRDTHVLVSAQAAFLPVPEEGEAEFNPVLFNYQSYQGDPAVLAIVATREGSSATIIDNVRDAFPAGFSWGQRLFFNQDGERASFTGRRLSDFLADEGDQRPGERPGGAVEASGQSGLNMVLLIQVPLKQKQPVPRMMEEEADLGFAPMAAEGMKRSDVEAAVIGHGAVEGPFTEIDGLEIERDPRFPIRVTVQFYKATSNGVVSEADVAEIAAQIERVYDDADYVGSLVVDGPSDRPTEYEGPKVEPEDWWAAFWQRFEENTGLSEADARELWRKLGFKAWQWWPRFPRFRPDPPLPIPLD